MDMEIPLAQERLILSKAILDIFRTISIAYYGDDQIGEHLIDTIIASAVLIGQVEGRLMSISDIAGFTGTPRATVHRRVKMAEATGHMACGKIRGRSVVWLVKVNEPNVVRQIASMLRRVARQLEHLSKMDTKKIVDHENVTEG